MMKKRILRTLTPFAAGAALFSAQTLFAWTVDETSKTISIGAAETVAYSELSAYSTDYSINLGEGAILTHNVWVFNPLTGTGTFQMTPNGYDGPQQWMGNLENFAGTVILDSSKGSIRLRGSGYSTFSSDMTLDISGNSQFWLNEDCHANLYLHDMGGAYDGLGLVRFDTNGKTITGNVSVSGNAGISVRQDAATATNTITGSITGVHASGDSVKDNVIFNVLATKANTHSTLVLKGENFWNGTTNIKHMTVQLTEAGTLGEGTISINGAGKNGDVALDAGKLVINKTSDFEMKNQFVGTGGFIVNAGENVTTFSGSLDAFVGTVDVQAGKVRFKPSKLDPETDGLTKLTGSGDIELYGAGTGSDFFINNYDFSEFEGTLVILEGRTRGTAAALWGENATVRVQSGSSIMFYEGAKDGAAGDYLSALELSGNGHTEGRGAIRFHYPVSGEHQKNLNTSGNVVLPNVVGDVTLLGDTFVNARIGDGKGWGVFSGDISGNCKLTLNDGAKGWIALTGTNSYGETHIQGGTVQIGYAGTLNGKTYDGTTGTLGTGKVTINSGAELDYRRTNRYTLESEVENSGTIRVSAGELNVTNSAFTNNGTIQVAEGAVFSRTVNSNVSGAYAGAGTIALTYSGQSSHKIDGNFSNFTGKIMIDGSDSKGRWMLSSQTVNFGENSTVNIGSHAQLYLLSSTIYGNLQFGTSTAYENDGTYQAAIRTDGASTSYIYGTVTLLKDDGVGAAISTRVKNEGNVEKGSKLVLYADVTGEGSLLKLEDSNDYAGVLSIGTIEKDGKTYGGTVDYAGPTNVRSGVLRILDGVTMYAQDDISLGDGTGLEGTFDLEKGAVLSIGAPDAKTGTELEFSGNGTVELGGTLEFDIFSESDFDKIILNADLLNLGELPESIDIKIAEGVEAGDEMIQLTQGFDTAFWEDVLVNLPSGWMYSISADGNLAVGGAAVVPEPGSMLLLLTGIGGLFMLRRKKCA